MPGELLGYVHNDVNRVLKVLEPLMTKCGWNNDDFKQYAVSAHGIKCVMANIADRTHQYPNATKTI